MIFYIPKIHFSYAIQQFYKFLIALCNCSTQFIAAYIIVIKQTCKIILRFAALCRFLNVTEYTFQCFI